MRDNQRSKLYKAEKVIFDMPCNYTFTDLRAITRYTKKLLKQEWFQRLHLITTEHPLHDIQIKDGRGSRRSRCKGVTWALIQLPKHGRNLCTVIHEISHAFVPFNHEGHGRLFAGVYLYLTKRLISDEAYKALLASFKEHGIKFAIPEVNQTVLEKNT